MRSKKIKKISVIIPIYQNNKSINSLFRELGKLEKKLNEHKASLEIVCVDDGSTDGSYKKLLKIKKIKKNLKLIKFSKNYGASTALIYGMKFIKGDAVTFLAADLQDDPLIINTMVKKWIQGSKLVICERSSRSDPFLSKCFSKFYYFLVRKLINKKFPREGFDMFLLDKKYFNFILNSEYETNIPLLVFSIGINYNLIRSERRLRKYGESQWTLNKKISLFFNTFIKFSNNFVKLAINFSVIIFIISIIYTLFIFYEALSKNIGVEGYASIIIFIGFYSSLIIFLLGIVMQYLYKISKKLDTSNQIIVEKFLK